MEFSKRMIDYVMIVDFETKIDKEYNRIEGEEEY
jgi:hypothetical protein